MILHFGAAYLFIASL